jgi:surfactin synthase thioesterase subunit
MKPSSWLPGPALPSAKLRLYCFSYAGGSAQAYGTWQAALGPHVEVRPVQLPGRGMRMHEAPLTTMQDVVVAFVQELLAQPQGMPFAFFGHSMGALVALETARFCARHGLRMPQQLIVSGAAAPRYRAPSRDLHKLSDAELIAELEEYGGSPPEVLEHRELMELLLPMIRADFALIEQYVYRPSRPLALPMTVLVGAGDSHTTVEHADKWQEETTGPCEVHTFEGGHFFIQSDKDKVLACLRAVLSGEMATS